MPPRKRTLEAAELELSFLKNRRLADGWAFVMATAFRYAGLAAIAWCAYKSIEALAGKTTSAVASFTYEDKRGLPLWAIVVLVVLPWVMALGSAVFAYRERRLRQDTTERLNNRIMTLQLAVDPNRSSSALTKGGQTREEDKV